MNLEATTPVPLPRRPALWLLGAGLALAGCNSVPLRSPDEVAPALPTQFRHTTADADAPTPPIASEWWRTLAQGELDDLIARGLRDNPDLKIAELQIAQARARAQVVRAGGKPTLSLPVAAAAQSSASAIGSAPVGGDRTRQNVFQASLQASWRVDVWGEQAAREESAELQVLRATYERDNTRRNVVGNLLVLYVMALSLNDSMRMADEIVLSSEQLLRTVEQRYAAGDATVTELEQQRAAVHLQRTVLPTLLQQQEEVRSQLGLWLGTTTDQVPWPNGGLEGIALPRVEAGLPSSLLLRRPDVRMMEARLRTAHADVEVARTQFLPSLDLSAQVGQSALRLAQLLRPEALFWSAVGSITAAIFDGGRREGVTAEAVARYEEMVLTYGKVIHQSLREVESALSLVRNAGLRYQSQQHAVASARALVASANQAFQAGALDSGGLVDARRSYQRQYDEMLRSKSEALRASVMLAVALAVL